MQEVREINAVEDLEEYRTAWSSLLAQTPGAGFFQSLEWLDAYWKHFAAGQRLRVLVVLEEGQPQGIVPLVVRSEPSRAGPIRFLTYPLAYWGSFYGPIGRSPERALEAGLAHVRRRRRDWDAIELRWAGGPDDDGDATARAMKSQRFQACRTTFDQTAIVRLEGTWDEYLAAKSSKWRNNFRRWQRRLAEQGAVSHVRYRPRGQSHEDADPRWDLFQVCLDLAQKSWQGSSQDGTTLSHPSIRDFVTDVHAAAARLGALDLNLLFLDDRPIAFAYNYCYRGYVYGLRIGYDAEACRDGVGNVLYARTIEDSFSRGDRLYDLGPGSLECKRQFLTETRDIVRYNHFPLLSLRSQLVRLKRNLDRIRLALSPV